MRPMARVLPAVICVGACSIVAAVAWGAQTLTFEARLQPDKLGSPTNVTVNGKFTSTSGGQPSPITNVTAYLPAGVKLDLRGLGTCTSAKLQAVGPSGCPANSRAGFGGGVGLLELAKELIHEPYTIDIFLGPSEDGHRVFLAYVFAKSPALIELVLKATEIHAPKPYGIGFSIEVPPIPTLPGASNASVESAFVTFGANNISYFQTIDGKKTLLHVKGIVLPDRCPQPGLQIGATVDFADGTATTGKTTIPCPGR